MTTRSFKQLSTSERDQIAILFNKKKYSLRDIALALSRNVSTISREIHLNSVVNKKTWLLEYVAQKAIFKKYVRRKYCKITLKKIIEHKDLKRYIHEKIWGKYSEWSMKWEYLEWSPEVVSHMWNIDHPNSLLTISPKTIYEYCYSVWWQTLCPHLYQKRYHPKKQKKKEYMCDKNGIQIMWTDGKPILISSKKVLIPERVWLDERAEIITSRSRIWDTESDFIVSTKDDHTALATNIDRKSRYLQAILIPQRNCDEANRALTQMMDIYNTATTQIHSVTLDNDIAFQHHTELRDKMHIDTYFCHPYHSWEKGQIEYGNRLIRRSIPKKSLLMNYSQKEIDRIIQKSNNTPRKCLGWKTPIQVLQEEGVAIGGKI